MNAIQENLKVISVNEDYLVIDKPAKIRMTKAPQTENDCVEADNDTVEDRVLKWLAINQNSCNSENAPAIAPKWVHQLDYATSGVLCIALKRLIIDNSEFCAA